MKIVGDIYEIAELIRWCERTRPAFNNPCENCPFETLIKSTVGTGNDDSCLGIESICEVTNEY